MIWPNSMKKRWFRRFVSLVSLTLGNSVSWGTHANSFFQGMLGIPKNDLRDQGTPIILYGRLYTNYETQIHSDE